MKENIRVIQYGLGPIGCSMAQLVVERAGLQLVGGIDIDPAKIGKDVGEAIGLGRSLGFNVVEKLSQEATRADVVLHTTSSYFDFFKDQVFEILEAEMDVVSTSEELSFPWLNHADDAAQVDDAAKRAGKTVMGTGINPGFLMDSLPLFLTSICLKVTHIEVTRVINASLRRGPFQAKIGSGLTLEAFNEKMAAGHMGHVGLPESVGMVFDTVGKNLARYEASVKPEVAEKLIKTDYFEVQPGQVKGLKQVARAYTDEGEFMTLAFIATLEAADDGDTIKITGRPDLTVKLQGTNGDLATVAIAVNAIRRVREASPGLVTMRDLPIVSIF